MGDKGPLPELVRVPAGTFVMGSDQAAEDARPAHRVHLDEFLVGAQPVTNEDFARFVRATEYGRPDVRELPLIVTTGGTEREQAFRQMAAPYAWAEGEPPGRLPHHPVTLVRLEDALAYCAWLASTIGRPIRLPTEAEWEKAARGGLEGRRYPWGDELDASHANYLPDLSLKAMHGSKPVRSFAPNAYGLYDMAGNVWEWVADWYDPHYYRNSPLRNPQGPPNGRLRVVRGGSWVSANPELLTCAHRHAVPGDTYSFSIGFRIAC